MRQAKPPQSSSSGMWLVALAIITGIFILTWRHDRKVEPKVPASRQLAPAKKVVKRAPAQPKPAKRQRLKGLQVVLDPGHGGPDPGSGWISKVNIPGKKGVHRVQFWEASYTYLSVRELAQLLINEGAVVSFTERSSLIQEDTTYLPHECPPLPRDARLSIDNSPSFAGKSCLTKRAEIANRLLDQVDSRDVVFLAIHSDSMSPGYTGAHVLCDIQEEASELACIIGDKLKAKGYGWKRDGKEKEMLRGQGLWVMRQCITPNKAYIEMATPSNASDSWRLRSKRHRLALLRAIRDAIIEWRKSQQSNSASPG